MPSTLLTFPDSYDFRFTALLDGYSWIFIFAILVLGLSLFVGLAKIFAAQLLLLFVFYAVPETLAHPLFIPCILLQFIVGGWLTFRIERDIEKSYAHRLVTPVVPPIHLPDENSGNLQESKI